MRFMRNHWYDVGPGLAVVAAIWALTGEFTTVQFILLLNFIVFLLHEFEEYRLPGGEPWVLNEVFQPSGGPPDRYKANQNNVLFINMMCWVMYLVPIFVPTVIWVGLAPVLFGLVGQVIVHVIITNRKLKTFYNPGQAAVLLGHVPLGIWYLVEVHQQALITGWDWVLALAYVLLFGVVIMQGIGFRLLAATDSPYPFTPAEMSRWNRVERLQRAGITPLPLDGDVSKAPV